MEKCKSYSLLDLVKCKRVSISLQARKIDKCYAVMSGAFSSALIPSAHPVRLIWCVQDQTDMIQW